MLGVVIAVVGVALLLLVVAFRSILVPVKAALMNLLSIGASFGVVTAVFQWGWGVRFLGVDQAIPIMSFVPLFMFALIFGLSMDYEVFLLSRIREEYDRTGDPHESVVTGIASTARLITSAALIMIFVFASFVPQPDPTVKMMALGLAIAVAVDATIVRLVLVPALMSLLGHANWWFPGAGGRRPPRPRNGGSTPSPEHENELPAPPGAGKVAADRHDVRTSRMPLIREYPIAEAAGPYGITAGADGALWLTLVHSGEIARLATDGTVTRHPAGPPGCGPTIITPGPDGALWFSRTQDHHIGRITTSGEVTGFALPGDGGPFGIAPGPDGALWFTEMNTDHIGRITPEGEITRIALPALGGFPSMITAGPDGALWFTLNQAAAIGRVTTDGEITVHDLPTAGAGPVGITCGADGALWFVEIAAGRIGRITVDGDIREFPLDENARPHAITAAPGGDCWFTEWGAGRIGRVTPAGEITGYDLPTPSSEPHGITVGPDGAVWTALEIGAVARLDAATP